MHHTYYSLSKCQKSLLVNGRELPLNGLKGKLDFVIH